MRPLAYEVTFSGQAGRTLRAQFDDCEVITSSETTTLRAELPDQCALSGLIQRIIDLRLEITQLLLIPPPTPCAAHQAHAISPTARGAPPAGP